MIDLKSTVQITGHTDDVGSDSYNLNLSRRRAQGVHAALTRLLPGTALRFQVVGKGETEPAVRATTPQARARNRRVEVSFTRATRPAPPPPPAATTAPGQQPAGSRSARPAGPATTRVRSRTWSRCAGSAPSSWSRR